MADDGIAEARDQLADLIDRAQAGEGVVLMRDGQAMAEIVPVARPKPAREPRPWEEHVAWLRAHRVGTTSSDVDAATLVRA